MHNTCGETDMVSPKHPLQNLPEWAKLLLAFIFVSIVFVFSLTQGTNSPNQIYLIIASVVGAYMAINIGANDVANNVGPAVGSGVLTILAAILIAAVFESLGALIGGGEVVDTIKKGIIDPAAIGDTDTFIWLMIAALISGGIWLNLATAVGAPVSTTHSIVGGILGAGIVAGGWDIVDWGVMGKIVASWVISPLMGGIIAAGLLYFIKASIIYQKDRLTAARRVIPILIAAMAWAFITYLLIKGAKHIYKFSFTEASLIGLVASALIYLIVKPLITRAIAKTPSSRQKDINELFTIPLTFAVAILSFAHGANDVANAVGPLAAINNAVVNMGIASKANIPLWVMLIGALGISIGLALYGPKLIETVGTDITSINKTRAYCIAMAASITVIIASQLGLPISSTHVAVGAVFGVGFLRELLTANYNMIIDQVREQHEQDEEKDERLIKFLEEFEGAAPEEKTSLLRTAKRSSQSFLSKNEYKALKKVHKQQLVQRSVFKKILAAWFITVPSSAILSAIFFYIIRLLFS